MDLTNYQDVDRYFTDQLVKEDPSLKELLAHNLKEGLPAHDVSPSQGKFLALLTKIAKAERVLEIGTLGGYSTLWFASALPIHGKIVTLEYSAQHARVARDHFKNNPLAHKIELIEGAAADTLQHLIDRHTEPFDLIFIDADKENNSLYLELGLQLAKVGTIIIGDNVVRHGEVLNEDSPDGRVQGVRSFIHDLSTSPHLDSTALETVGLKGYDGFTISLVNSTPHH